MKRQHIYAAWLSIATVTEISHNFQIDPLYSIFLNLIYIFGFIHYVFVERAPWVSRMGFGLIGIVSIFALLFQMAGAYTPVVRAIDTALCSYFFFHCLVWLKRYENGEVTLD